MLLDLPQLTGKEKTEDLIEIVAKLQKTVQFLMNGKIGKDNIRAKSITADRMDVNELSAITANIGEVTAGIIRGIQIIGAYIATAEGTYPRIEFSSSGNLLSAYLNALSYIALLPVLSGAPALDFVFNGIRKGSIAHGASGLSITAPDLALTLTAWTDIEMNTAFGQVKFLNWSQIFNRASGRTLQQELDSLSMRISALEMG